MISEDETRDVLYSIKLNYLKMILMVPIILAILALIYDFTFLIYITESTIHWIMNIIGLSLIFLIILIVTYSLFKLDDIIIYINGIKKPCTPILGIFFKNSIFSEQFIYSNEINDIRLDNNKIIFNTKKGNFAFSFFSKEINKHYKSLQQILEQWKNE